MTEEEARARVAVARVGRLATIDRNGRPHVVPICFAMADDRIVSVVDDKPKRTTALRRLDNVRDHPDVQLVVDHYDDDDWSALWWVRISGRAHVLERGTAHESAIDLLAEKYRHYRVHRPSGPVLVIEISTISGWEAASA
jgi:PPOX class probable F420-dependent enzyme